MRKLLMVALVVTTGCAQAATYTVRNTDDSGRGSLRWAIGRANAHAGGDEIVFTVALTGRTIHPLSPLPALMDNRTTINGDTNADGAPDVAITAPKGSTIDGLVVLGNHCRIIGLTINNFRSGVAISVTGVTDCRIRCCHLGVNLAGAEEVLNRRNVYLTDAHGCRIGGANWDARNVIAGGLAATVRLDDSNDNVIAGNFIGLTRDGSATLRPGPSPWYPRNGIELYHSQRNTIGGTRTAEGNVFAGLSSGVHLGDSSDGNTVVGNWFGLASDGRRLLEINRGLGISHSSDNRIGGANRAARNVFAGNADPAIEITTGNAVGSAPAEGNVIQGNYFGMNAAGTAQRQLRTGIRVRPRAKGVAPPGRQVIGGSSRWAGNWFCPYSPGATTRAVHFDGGGGASVVRNNVFGVFPSKVTTRTPRTMTSGIRIEDVDVAVRDNSIWRATWGVQATGNTATRAAVYGNLFNGCVNGVGFANGASGALGDLGNRNTNDDGGNRFVGITNHFIVNGTPFDLPAEGNDFGMTSAAAIDAKILDRLDYAAFGRVDYDPLVGGVSPSGAVAGALVVSGAAALPTRQGAEIVFALSASARVEVTVRNVAGRVVAVVCRGRDCEAGHGSVVWDGRSAEGLALPAGRYLAEVVASAQDGGRATAVAPMQLTR